MSQPDTTHPGMTQATRQTQTQTQQKDDVPPSVRKLARLMDSSIRLPGGFRVGLDAIIGLVPVVGDLVGTAISMYIVGHGVKAGARPWIIIKMLFNTVLEATIGAIPILGDVFDMFFKANLRNVKLLERQLAENAESAENVNVRNDA